MKRLGVNIDHVATVRNARGMSHPDPTNIAKHVKKVVLIASQCIFVKIGGIYKDSDVVKICKNKKIITNLEISLNEDILKVALKNKPNFICIVPEKRKEITTEGGLDYS